MGIKGLSKGVIKRVWRDGTLGEPLSFVRVWNFAQHHRVRHAGSPEFSPCSAGSGLPFDLQGRVWLALGGAHFCDRCDAAVRTTTATALPTWVSVRRADVRFGEAVAISIELCAATFWRCDGGSGGSGGDAVTSARGVIDNVHGTLCRSHRSPRANFHAWPKPTAHGTTPVERQPATFWRALGAVAAAVAMW